MAKKNKKNKQKNLAQPVLSAGTGALEQEFSKQKSESEIFVFGETTENSFLPVVFELLNSARKLSSNFSPNLKVSVVTIVQEPLKEELKNLLYKGGADKIYQIQNDKIINSIGAAKGIIELCKEKTPQIFLFGATPFGRTIAPLISSALNTGLTADCTELSIVDFKEEKKLAATRPTFGGQLMATILCKELPQMATVRPSVFKKTEETYKETGEEEFFTPKLENLDPDCIKIIDVKDVKETSSIENAKIIVAGGMGLKNEEGFNKLKKFASLINAPYAGSRKAVEKGFVEKEFQIGQTGKTAAPEVYLAFGISGAIHHMAGIENAKKIIAINSDENAPIFKNADVAIVKDASSLLDDLISKLEGELS